MGFEFRTHDVIYNMSSMINEYWKCIWDDDNNGSHNEVNNNDW